MRLQWIAKSSAMVLATLLAASISTGAFAATIGDGLGFGKFLGTWETDPPSSSGFPNPHPSGAPPSNVTGVGQAILNKWPGLFDINDFNFAGSIDNYGGSPVNFYATEGLVFDKTDGFTGSWTYQGFNADPPGDDPVDLYVAVKYNTFVSVFEYADPHVVPGDHGWFSSDYTVILANTADGDEAALRYNNFSSQCSLATGFNADCMARNYKTKTDKAGNIVVQTDSPYGVSHVVGYWPPVETTDIPEPWALGLLGSALVGLVAMRRRRR